MMMILKGTMIKLRKIQLQNQLVSNKGEEYLMVKSKDKLE
jgi:hypothetical protein